MYFIFTLSKVTPSVLAAANVNEKGGPRSLFACVTQGKAPDFRVAEIQDFYIGGALSF